MRRDTKPSIPLCYDSMVQCSWLDIPTPLRSSGEKQPRIGNHVCSKIGLSALSMRKEHHAQKSCPPFALFAGSGAPQGKDVVRTPFISRWHVAAQ
jgi:hypothetical protein